MEAVRKERDEAMQKLQEARRDLELLRREHAQGERATTERATTDADAATECLLLQQCKPEDSPAPASAPAVSLGRTGHADEERGAGSEVGSAGTDIAASGLQQLVYRLEEEKAKMVAEHKALKSALDRAMWSRILGDEHQVGGLVEDGLRCQRQGKLDEAIALFQTAAEIGALIVVSCAVACRYIALGKGLPGRLLQNSCRQARFCSTDCA